MVKFWSTVRGKEIAPSREENAVLEMRAQVEKKRKELERAIAHRADEIDGLVQSIIPIRGREQ